MLQTRRCSEKHQTRPKRKATLRCERGRKQPGTRIPLLGGGDEMKELTPTEGSPAARSRHLQTPQNAAAPPGQLLPTEPGLAAGSRTKCKNCEELRT